MKKRIPSKSKVLRKFVNSYSKRTEPIYYSKKDIVLYRLSILFFVLGMLGMLFVFTNIILFLLSIVQFVSIVLFISILLLLLSGLCFLIPILETIYLLIKK